MPKLQQPRVRGIEDLRPKSDGRLVRKVTNDRALDAPVGFWPTDLPVPYWPLPSATTRNPAGALAGKAVGS